MRYNDKVHTEDGKARSSSWRPRLKIRLPGVERGALLLIAASNWRRPIKFATRRKGGASRSPRRLPAEIGGEWFAIMMQLVFPT